MKSEKDSLDNLWLPFSYHEDNLKNPPITITSGSGMYIFDENGGSYMDAVGSWWTSVLGHNNSEITEAVRNQLSKLEHVIMAGFITPPARELSHLLAGILPGDLSRIFYSDDGSTSIELAMKVAMQYWALRGKKRNRFVSFGGAYHGDTLGAMSVGGIASYHTLFQKLFVNQYHTDPPHCFRCPCGKNRETCGAECMDSLERILKEHGSEIAAFVFEPIVQGAAGMKIYPPRVLTRAFELCRKYGILTIDDEVAMGFGRTGKMFACEHAGVEPDIMCLSKCLTAGYLPLAVTAFSERIYREFAGGFPSERILNHGHTFTGNPLAASAACAVLKIFKRENFPFSIEKKMEYFRKKLEIFREIDIAGDLRSIGMVGALELVSSEDGCSKPLPERRLAYRICQRAMSKGLLIRPLGDVIYFIPAFIITEEEIDIMLEKAYQSMREIRDEEASYL